jgi:hypothetical protein
MYTLTDRRRRRLQVHLLAGDQHANDGMQNIEGWPRHFLRI